MSSQPSPLSPFSAAPGAVWTAQQPITDTTSNPPRSLALPLSGTIVPVSHKIGGENAIGYQPPPLSDLDPGASPHCPPYAGDSGVEIVEAEEIEEGPSCHECGAPTGEDEPLCITCENDMARDVAADAAMEREYEERP
jgi:hypothetical protein